MYMSRCTIYLGILLCTDLKGVERPQNLQVGSQYVLAAIDTKLLELRHLRRA